MRDIMFLQLERIAYSDLFGMQLTRQESIVVASSAAYTMAMLVKHHSWHDDQINLPMVGLRLRLRNAQTPFAHHVLAVIRTNLHRVTMGYRQQK